MLGHLLRRCHQTNTAIWSARFGPLLTPAQFAVIAVAAVPGGLDLQTIGAVAALDKSTMTGVVRRLESGGWVKRRVDPVDRRRSTLALTPASGLALAQSWTLVAAAKEDFLAPIPEGDRERLMQQLRQLARVEKVVCPGLLGEVWSQLLETPGHLVRRAQQAHTGHWAAEFGKTLTGPQFAVLRMLEVAGPMSQAKLGELTALDKSTLSGVVRRLALRGLVVREQDRADLRSWVVSSSAEGSALGRRVFPRAERVQQATVAAVPVADRQRMLEALENLAFRSGRPEIAG